ncbi:MAG: DUF58 domain-containing protein [Anaerolineae bacterium]
MKRSRLVLLLWLIIGFGAIGTGRELFYNLWYLLTSLLVFSFLWAWSGVRWVEVERQTRTTRSQVGKMMEERLVVKNRGRLPKLWLEVLDHSTLPHHAVSRVISPLGANKIYSRTIKTRCLQRGSFTLGPITLLSGDPFGLFQISRRLDKPAETTVLVYPATVDVPTFAPLVGLLPGGDTIHRRTPYVTTNVSGIREYVPGDAFNRIHWPSTARTGRLISKEFELDPTADIWIFLDLERAAQAELSRGAVPLEGSLPWHTDRSPELEHAIRAQSFWARLVGQPRVPLPWEWAGSRLTLAPSTVEYGTTIAASLAKHFIARDRAVGLIAYSHHREMIPPDRGERQLTKILETLAVIQAEGHIPLAEVIAAEGAHLRRNTTAIVITPTDQKDWIMAAQAVSQRGVKLVAVLIESRSFGQLSSNENLVSELSISGISTYLVRAGDDLSQALSRPYAPAIPSIGRVEGEPVFDRRRFTNHV